MTIIPKSVYNRFFSDQKLHEPDRKLRDYSGNFLRMHGYILLSLFWNDACCVEKVYVLNSGNPPLLGIKAFENLNMYRY